jgi:hypothetical protein
MPKSKQTKEVIMMMIIKIIVILSLTQIEVIIEK